jgi:uncharacterized protein YegL
MWGRKKPIYILIDVGSNMNGPAIHKAKEFVGGLLQFFRGYPQALEETWLSFICVGREFKVILPLTELLEVKNVSVSLEDSVAETGDVLQKLRERISLEVVPPGDTTKGDHPANAFWLSDGTHTELDSESVRRVLVESKVENLYYWTVDCSRMVVLYCSSKTYDEFPLVEQSYAAIGKFIFPPIIS